MFTECKKTFCLSILTLLLAWSSVSESQVTKRYGRATRNKSTQLTSYKIGQLYYHRPWSYLEGSYWRLKLFIPYADVTRYSEYATKREWKFFGYGSSCMPYSFHLSYNWIGIEAISMADRSFRLGSESDLQVMELTCSDGL